MSRPVAKSNDLGRSIAAAPLPRPRIMEIAPYVPGASKAPGATRIVKLSSNETPFGPSPKAIAAYQALADRLHRYPDGAARELCAAIGRVHALDPDRLVCGAGSDDLIQLLVRGYAGPGDEIIYTKHGFSIYPIAALSVGADPIAVEETRLTADVDAILGALGPRTRMVMLANPNNPTGTYLPASEIERLIAGLPSDVMLVLDGAYADYVVADDYEAGAAWVDRYPNVVMLRTFSKIYGLASLRLGWGYFQSETADLLHRIRGPFNVSTPAQAAGIAAIEDQAFVAQARTHNEIWRRWLTEQLMRLGLETTPSVANFVLVRLPSDPARNAAAAYRYLAARGYLTRAVTGYHLPEHLRITVGLESDLRGLVDLLGEFLA